MKKYFVLALILSTCFATQAKPFYKTSNVVVLKDRFGKKSKDGTFKRKRSGFLGLFGKKNACDCPRH